MIIVTARSRVPRIIRAHKTGPPPFRPRCRILIPVILALRISTHQIRGVPVVIGLPIPLQGSVKPVVHRILHGGIAQMVHHHIHNHADPLCVTAVHKGLEILLRTHIGINIGIIDRPVSVIGIIRKSLSVRIRIDIGIVALYIRRGIPMNLLIRRRDPDRVDTQIRKIPLLHLLRQTAKISAVEGAGISIGIQSRNRCASLIQSPSVRVVVRLIRIQKPVRQNKIHIGIVPGKLLVLQLCALLHMQALQQLLALRIRGEISVLIHGVFYRIPLMLPLRSICLRSRHSGHGQRHCRSQDP